MSKYDLIGLVKHKPWPFAKNRGFTLVELMVVVAIIGIIAAILLPYFARARFNALLAACDANERNLGNLLAIYAVDFSGKFPPDLATLNTYSGLSVAITCPTTNTTYGYQVSALATMYTVYCTGAHDYLLGPPAALGSMQPDGCCGHYPIFTGAGGLQE